MCVHASSDSLNEVTMIAIDTIRLKLTIVADTLSVADITRRDMAVHVAANDDLNVLGMNWLSSLKRWGVEGRWLILEA